MDSTDRDAAVGTTRNGLDTLIAIKWFAKKGSASGLPGCGFAVGCRRSADCDQWEIKPVSAYLPDSRHSIARWQWHITHPKVALLLGQ